MTPALHELAVEIAPAGAKTFHRLPETRRVVHVFHVRQLVNDDLGDFEWVW